MGSVEQRAYFKAQNNSEKNTSFQVLILSFKTRTQTRTSVRQYSRGRAVSSNISPAWAEFSTTPLDRQGSIPTSTEGEHPSLHTQTTRYTHQQQNVPFATVIERTNHRFSVPASHSRARTISRSE